MGKIVFAAILCLLSSCKSASRYTYDEQKYNLIIEYNPWIKIDLNNRVAIMEFHDFKSVDTLDLTTASIDAIKSSFEKNRIGIIHGDVSYGDPLELPAWGLKVKIFRAEKLQAYLSIFNEIHFNNSPVSEGDKHAFRFKDEIYRVLEKSKKFKAVKEKCREQQKKSNEYLM
ncbi:hypothetical protein [Arcticibacter tournemirensis]